jgi:Protein of unknown function (DUF3313)
MKMKHHGVTLAMVTAGALLLGGCGGSHQARNVDLKNTLLINPDILQKGTGDQVLYRYVNPDVKLKDYSRILMDPVIIAKEAQLDANELENYRKLANNFYVYTSRELGKLYPIVTEPGPGTMRVQAAIVDADRSQPVRTILSFTPFGMGVNVLKYAAIGKPSGVGEITVELKVTDAITGQLLGAAVDRRVGGSSPKNVYDIWANADDALQYWAKKMTFVLCRGQGRDDCVKP